MSKLHLNNPTFKKYNPDNILTNDSNKIVIFSLIYEPNIYIYKSKMYTQ